jgi:hypothetical protein
LLEYVLQVKSVERVLLHAIVLADDVVDARVRCEGLGHDLDAQINDHSLYLLDFLDHARFFD